MSEKGYYKQINHDLKAEILEALKNYTIQGKRQSLVISNPIVTGEVDPDDFNLQKQLKLQDKSFGIPVSATVKLIDNQTGKVLDQQKQKILNIPVMTPRNSFIQDGTEYQSKMQLRLKPAVYTRVKDNGELESQFNLERGSNFSLTLDPEQSKIMLELGTSSVNVYPLLKILGIADSQLERQIGTDLLKDLKQQEEKTTTRAAEKMYEYFNSTPAESSQQAESWVKDFFANTKMDPDITKITLGDKYDSVTPKALMAAVKKLVEVSRGDAVPDNRENMIFKRTLDVVDILKERMTKKLRNFSSAPLLKYKVDRAEKVDGALPKSDLRALTDKFFLESGLVNSTEQTNPLSMLESASKVTITGEGGITNSHAITEDARLIHDSQMGLLDPIHTPSSNLVGAVVGTSTGSKKIGNSLGLELIDSKTGKLVFKTPEELVDIPVGLPDQFTKNRLGNVKAIGKRVFALLNNNMGPADSKDIRYFMSDPRKMFGLATNLMPYAASNHANRAQMSSKLMEQASSLVQRDAPLVETISPEGPAYVDTIGDQFSFKAPVSGEVTKVTDATIEVTDSSGKKHKVSLYHNFPLNRQSDLNSYPNVTVGQKVKEGELLADTNFTSNGKLALGKNMTIAYLPFKGLTYEDGIVISESAAKKLTSRHTHKITQGINPQTTLNKEKYVAYFPKEFTASQLNTLDTEGVVKEGTIINHGDPLILALVSDEFGEEAQMLKKFKKSLVSPFKNISQTWSGSFQGVVTNVAKTPTGVTVYVTVEQPVVVGDKLVSAHANKGIVTAVVPDSELPRTAEGTVPDILYSPLSIPSRVNPSQMLEIAAGKLAIAEGKPYQLENFNSKNYLKELIAELKKKKIKVDEVLYDPKTNKPVGETLMGPQYTFKLHHVVEDKLSSRFLGGYDLNSQPTSPAQNVGMHDMHALLAYGMKKTLKEMATYKSERNDEFWRNFQVGGPLPKPQPSFAFDKLVSYLKVLGVNTVRNDDQLVLMPLSDKEILKESKGAVNDSLMVKGKNLEPMRQGLFDENTTGGLGGKNWTHIPLQESIVNPTFAQPIAHLLNITKNDLEDIIGGKKFINPAGAIVTDDTSGAMSGSAAIKRSLEYVENNTDMLQLQDQASKAKGSMLNKLHRKLRYLTALKETGLKATEAYMVDNVPVLPPLMRPIFPMDDGSVRVSSLNYLYRDLLMANKQLKDTKHLPDDIVGEIRLEIYKALKALQGLGSPITKLPTRDIRGIMQLVSGTDQAKNGFIQSVVFKRPQELSGRSTITLGLNMHPDEINIPELMAWDIFKPFVIKELVSMGRRPNEAIDMVESKDPLARQVLEVVSKDRLVLASRAPVLHKFGYQAFKPLIHSGRDIKVHPLVMAGMNADLDGDCCIDACFVVVDVNKLDQLTSALKSSNVGVDLWINERSISMPANVNLPLLDNEILLHLNLEDFPRIESTKMVTEGGTIVYKVPDGIKIVTVDNETCDPVTIPVTEFSIHPNLQNYHIITSDESSLWVSEDHSLVAYDLDTFSITPVSPDKAVGRALPKVREINCEVALTKVTVADFAEGKPLAVRANPEAELTEEFGHLLGIMIGDGWVSKNNKLEVNFNRISIANVDYDIKTAFEQGISNLLTAPRKIYTKENPHDFRGHASYSEKHTITSVSLAGNFERWIGTGAENKHLPPWYLPTPKEFRLGLLTGLIDTDGSCYWSSTVAKKVRQLQVSYSTISPRLAQEIVTLCRSLGISARVSDYGKEFRVQLSTTDIHTTKLNLRESSRANALKEFQSTAISEKSTKFQIARHNQVPFGPQLFKIAKSTLKAGMTKHNKDNKQASLYAVAHKASKKGTISRVTARELIAHSDSYPSQWVDVVNNERVTWVTVKEMTKSAKPVTMYDITAPGPYTFMTSSGIVIQDTFSIHAPVSQEVLQDTAKALPSRNLIGPKSGELMMAVDKEAALGLYKLTDDTNAVKSDLKYDSITQLTKDLRDGLIHGNELVKLNGKEVMAGKVIIGDLLGMAEPPTKAMTKKMVNGILKKIALSKDPTYADRANDLEHLGFDAAWRINGGTKFSDLAAFSEVKEKEMPKLVAGIGKLTTRKAADVLKDGIDKLLQKNIPGLISSKNSIYEMMASGARGNLNQFKQMVMAPGFTIDAKSRVIPVPVTSSYAEGLPFHQYWSAMHGGRKGTVETQLATAGPGELYKQALNSMESEVVTIKDCHTTEGVVTKLTDPDILGKLLTQDVNQKGQTLARRGTPLTAAVVEQLIKAGLETVVVRSPVFCKAEEGVCAACYGIDENGSIVRVGTHVGVIAAHSLTEPLTQMMLSSKHTGGVYTGDATQFTGIKAIKSMLTLPRVFPDKATLSKVKGRVDQILKNPAGGWNVFIEGKKHFSLTEPTISAGQSVGRGDPISQGIMNPRDVLELKGIDSAKRFLAKKIKELYAAGGASISGRHIDILTKAMTNISRVVEPGDSEFLPGDIVPTSKIRYYNKNRMVDGDPANFVGGRLAEDVGKFKSGTQITTNVAKELSGKVVKILKNKAKYRPELSGVNMLPLANSEWLSRLNYTHLKDTIMDGAAMRWKTHLHGINPIPAYMYGAEFGDPGDDSPQY